MKKIRTAGGKYAIVDDEDYRFLSNFSWTTDEFGDVSTNFKVKGVWVRVPMNRFLYKPKIQYKPAYKNKNPLDNRKSNIVLLTTSQFNGTSSKMYLNLARVGKSPKLRNPTSVYKGVCKISDPRYKDKTWKGSIKFQGKSTTKCFTTEKEAAIWYNAMALELFGETAYQNKII